MKKLLVLLALVFTVSACAPEAQELNDPKNYLPKELQDCKIYKIRPDGMTLLYVFRCPDSQTFTARTGKGATYTSIN